MLCDKPLMRFVLTPLAVAVLLVIAATAFAQTDTGKITGTVKDQNGAVVPGANITAGRPRKETRGEGVGHRPIPFQRRCSFAIRWHLSQSRHSATRGLRAIDASAKRAHALPAAL